jgi:hypothetical protein
MNATFEPRPTVHVEGMGGVSVIGRIANFAGSHGTKPKGGSADREADGGAYHYNP